MEDCIQKCSFFWGLGVIWQWVCPTVCFEGPHIVSELKFTAFAERGAGLGSGVIELGGLADDDGARADNHNFFDVGIFGHSKPLKVTHNQANEEQKRILSSQDALGSDVL